MPDGTVYSSSEHRELFDADDDHYDRRNIVESATKILTATCVSVNDGEVISPKMKRKLFLAMATPVREYVFFRILYESDPGGDVTKQIVCLNPACGKKFTVRAIEAVPTEEEIVSEVAAAGEVESVSFGLLDDDSGGVTDGEVSSGEAADGKSMEDLAYGALATQMLDLSDMYEDPGWRMLEAEKTFDLVKPVEVQIRAKRKKEPEAYVITSIRLRIQTGQDETDMMRYVQHMSPSEIARKLRARRILSADGIPEDMLKYVQSTAFIRRLSKVDQKRIERWDMQNRVLGMVQASTCPECGMRVPHPRDPGFFF
jgi:hypothetical protein